MSANTTPSPYNNLEDAFITDANFKVDINQKMQVPNKISFKNMQRDYFADANDLDYPPRTSVDYKMQVPERILVAGQDKHVGTRAPPREIIFDNSLLPSEPYPGDIRVATPPRTLTLDKYPFPGLSDFSEPEPDMLPVVKSKKFNLNDSDLNMSLTHRESTPPIGAGGEGLSVSEEVLHLRRQMAKLNRRVMALEQENLQRLQKEKILYSIGIAYFLLKTIIWLNKY